MIGFFLLMLRISGSRRGCSLDMIAHLFCNLCQGLRLGPLLKLMRAIALGRCSMLMEQVLALRMIMRRLMQYSVSSLSFRL